MITRFPPSPTGFLHIGGVRAALYNWLYARRHGGRFVLRIEDTDTERSEERFTQDILACMKWLGLTWDGDITFQSRRFDVYLAAAERLVSEGKAYRCTCSPEDVEKMRERAQADGKKPRYDGTCREKGVSKDVPHVIRVKLPLDGAVEFRDRVRGEIRWENSELDDFVIVRSNGTPTYNLVVVVDDADAGITLIARGDDHINNTPKQIHLYRFLGKEPPEFAHLPMILGPDKKKLSKRHGDVSANFYRGEGYLPEAMLNFLVRLGWSHGDQEIFTPEEMIEHFDFDHVQKSAAVFNAEKLLWLNGEHIKRAAPERLALIVKDDFAEHFSSPALERVNTAIGRELVRQMQPKRRTMKEFAEELVPLCTPGAVEVDTAPLKWNKKPDLKEPLKNAVRNIRRDLTAKMQDQKPVSRPGADAAWGTSPSLGDAGMGHEAVEAFLKQSAETHGVKLGDLTQPMRLTITGRMQSLGLFDLLPVLPWDVVDARLGKVDEL